MSKGAPNDRSSSSPESGEDARGEAPQGFATVSDIGAPPAEGQPKVPAIGDYLILEKIGSGGMGHVFKARHRRMDRIVALKVLPAGAMRNANAVERFHREVKAAAQLFHPNIVTAFDAGEQDGIHYLVMEYVEGQPFGRMIADKGRLPVQEAVDFALQAARGLHYAHSRDVVHRDIKPSNLMLDAEGVVKVLDMGMARFHGGKSDADEASPDGLTETGVIIGTVDFMSPEQAKNAKVVDHRTDIYSLGCTLYFLLTGRPVYTGDLVQTLLAHAANPIPSLKEAREDIPERLDAVYQKMLAKDPEDRYQTMSEVIDELENCGLGGLDSLSIEVADDRISRLTTALQDTAVGAADKGSSVVRRIHAVGIDLGTCFASVAHVDERGRPATIPNAKGELRIPSVVMIDGSNISIGHQAVEAIGAKGHCIAERVKRAIGQPLYNKPLSGDQYPPEVLLALILRKLADDARTRIGQFDQVAISVPAYFDEVRRKAVQDAGYIAGLTVADIVNEPTAATMWYSLRQGMLDSGDEDSEAQKLLVLDLGGGVFDATVFECKGSQVTALATEGDDRLGGCDWDDRLANVVAEQFVAEHRADPRRDVNAAGRLRRACEAAKCSLSSAKRATITYHYRGRSTRAKITREQLENISGDLIDRMRVIILRTLEAVGLEWGDIDQVLLVGESSRMPCVRRMVREISGKDPDMSALEHEAVAHGAALQAANQLAKKKGDRPRFKITEINSHSLGVVGIDSRSGQRRNAILIPRNTPLPATTKRTFRTKESERDSLQVRIVQGEDKSPEKCTRVGKCDIGALPAGLPPGSPITVEFHYGADGRLSVFVETSAHTRRAKKEIMRAAGLSQEHLDRWREWVETMTLCSNV